MGCLWWMWKERLGNFGLWNIERTFLRIILWNISTSFFGALSFNKNVILKMNRNFGAFIFAKFSSSTKTANISSTPKFIWYMSNGINRHLALTFKNFTFPNEQTINFLFVFNFFWVQIKMITISVEFTHRYTYICKNNQWGCCWQDHLHCPPATHLMPIHQMGNIVAWWYTCKKLIWLFFFLSTKKNVSIISTHLEK